MLRGVAAGLIRWAMPVTRCIYCGEFLKREPDVVNQHVRRECRAHPLREAEAEIARLGQALGAIESRLGAVEDRLEHTIAEVTR